MLEAILNHCLRSLRCILRLSFLEENGRSSGPEKEREGKKRREKIACVLNMLSTEDSS